MTFQLKKGLRPKKMAIRKWTFITPNKLSHSVCMALLDEAKQYGFEGDYLESTYLAHQRLKYDHILKDFPNLHIPRIESELEALRQFVQEKKKVPERDETLESEKTNHPTPAHQEVLEIVANGRTPENKSKLKTIFYKTTDDFARLQCTLSLLNWYSPLNDQIEDHLDYCEIGKRTAIKLNAHAEHAVILCYEGQRLSDQFCILDIHGAGMQKFKSLLGLSLQTDVEEQELLNKIKEIDRKWLVAFSAAQIIARRIGNPAVLAEVYLHIGNAAGTRTHLINT